MYYEMSFARPDTSYAYLSERLQNEIGSVEQWAQQEDIYTFTYMEFTQYPVAEVSGDTADVTFAVRLDHTWGSELLSGTWVCVVENGSGSSTAWKTRAFKPSDKTPAAAIAAANYIILRVIRFADRFVLEREIGSGGMSVVFLGRDESLDRPVAIKLLKPGYAGTDIGARFQREGRTAASSRTRT